MPQVQPCLAHLWGLRRAPRWAPPPESPPATLAPSGGSRKAVSRASAHSCLSPWVPWGGKRQGTARPSYGVTAQGQCRALHPAQGPLLSPPQSSLGSRGALSTALPRHPPTPKGADRRHQGLGVEAHALTLKRQERLGLTGLAEEALYESLTLSLTAAGWPRPTTVSLAAR